MNDWERLVQKLRRRLLQMNWSDLGTEIWLAMRWLACLMLLIVCPVAGYGLMITHEPLPIWAKEGGALVLMAVWLWVWWEIDNIPLNKDSS